MLKRGGEFNQAFANLRWCPGGEPKNERRLELRLNAKEGERRGSHSDIECDTSYHWKFFLTFEPGHDVQSCFRNLQSEMATKQFVELFNEKFSALGVDLPHPFDMTQEKTVIDKSRQRCLVDGRGVLIHRTADFDQCINQRLWRNDVAQSQRGTKNLAHCACVNDSTSFVDPLQRREWWSY